MNTILRKFKHKRKGAENFDETTFMLRNGETILRELISSSNGKYNPYRIFSALELKLATNNYDSTKLKKVGETYELYKGFWQGRGISVMKFENFKTSAYGCCINNIVYASQMIHKHILQLIGCCLETEIPILVFESVKYGTLADRIYSNTNKCRRFKHLQWTQRLKIAMDIANAIAYLHLGLRRPIVFMKLDLSSIVFNNAEIAKLFDFSLSISIPEGETHVGTDSVSGILKEYIIPPEYFFTGALNEKFDVYRFGVFLSELLTGQKALDLFRPRYGEEVNLQDHVKIYFEESRITDPLIVEEIMSFPEEKQQVKAFIQLISKCFNELPEDRPTMMDVAKQLGQMYRSSI